MSGAFVHRLWATFEALPASAAARLAGAVPSGRRARRRLEVLRGPGGVSRTPSRTSGAWRRLPVRDAAVAFGAVALGVVMVGGPLGCLLGAVAAYGLRRLARTRAAQAGESKGAYPSKFLETGDRGVESRLTGQLPIVAELLAACLAAGSSPREAAGAVGGSIGGPLGERLVRASAELRLGGDPAAVWGRLGEVPGAAGLARCLERAGTTGVPAVEPVGRLAAEYRARRARAATERARRAAVLVTGPLGLCFLPAFLLAGVVPVVIGLAEALL
ncbi:type II secretion system F family protein [Streptomyces megasporus]|uniref:type II secretion system F family protein n=1 Tax=Streptomyces megasporus TaxID=44060 RepID=UPI00068DDBA8|nr:type II secretion system F family protein [Streptomyces megasporus]